MPVTAAEILALVDRFDWEGYHASVKDSLGKAFGEVVAIQGTAGAKRAGASAFDVDDPFVKKQLTSYVGERIVSLDDTTKADVSTLIRNLIENGGLDPLQIGDAVAEKVREKFDRYKDWRADRIARNETAIAYNFGNVLGYRQAGVEKVQVIDGDGDEACRRANGQVWTLAQAIANPIEHPGCERDFAPVLSDDAS